MTFAKIFLALPFTAAVSAFAGGAPVGEYQLNLGGISYHIPHNKPHNEINYGLGVEYQWTESIAVQGGWYKNSGNHGSKYVFAQYHPFEAARWKFGATAGFVSGYKTQNDGGFTPIIIPSFSRQFKDLGINGFFAPPGLMGKGKEGLFFVGFKIPFKDLEDLNPFK